MDNITCSFSTYELKSSHIIRICVSDVAAVSGYHSWTNTLEKFETYIYQDLADLYRLDIQNLYLDISQIDLESLTPFLSVTDIDYLKSVENDSDSKGAYKDVTEVQKSLQAIDKIFKKVEAKNSIAVTDEVTDIPSNAAVVSAKTRDILLEQIKFLKSNYQGKVCKRYGITCEPSALDVYSEMTGFPVDSRNTTQLTWHIPMDSNDLEGAILGLLNTQHSGNSSVFKSKELTNVLSPYIFSSYRNSSCKVPTQTLSQQTHAFTITGRPDGISYHLDMTSEDHAQWQLEVRIWYYCLATTRFYLIFLNLILFSPAGSC